MDMFAFSMFSEFSEYVFLLINFHGDKCIPTLSETGKIIVMGE